MSDTIRYTKEAYRMQRALKDNVIALINRDDVLLTQVTYGDLVCGDESGPERIEIEYIEGKAEFIEENTDGNS